MTTYSIEINPWEKFVSTNPSDLQLNIGDFVVLANEFGEEGGKIKEVGAISDGEGEKITSTIERLASQDDLKIIDEGIEKQEQAVKDCYDIIKKSGLEMKIVGSHYSLDGQRLSFAFIADGRIDFRELVKDLGRHFQKVIRLHQLGVRDEAKLVGDIGSCGLGQCCKGHLKKLGSVTSEFAEDQQVVHRGSERLSGICGRLKCCLAYEEAHYQELIKKLPPVGTRVKTKHGRGQVIGWHVLKCSVDVRIDPAKADDKAVIVEVPIK